MSGEGKDTEMTRISKDAKARLREIQAEILAETGYEPTLTDVLSRLVLADRKPVQP